MFDGANLILISDVDQDKWMLGSHEDNLSMHHLVVNTSDPINILGLSKYKSRYKKEMEQR